jgi:hypothetical protein
VCTEAAGLTPNYASDTNLAPFGDVLSLAQFSIVSDDYSGLITNYSEGCDPSTGAVDCWEQIS